jgi:hypothetical protein
MTEPIHPHVMSVEAVRFPAWRGGVLALLAAGLFGASTPFVQRLGAGVGDFVAAALLYAGAAFAGSLLRRDVDAEARVRRGDLPRLAWMTVFGAVVGPVALVWGLQRTSATSASLMLALEAVLTAAASVLLYREHLGRRAALAMASMTAGAVALVLDRASGGSAGLPGLLAVVGATAAWAVDNTLSRGLSDRDPGRWVHRSRCCSRVCRNRGCHLCGRRRACSWWAPSATASACASTCWRNARSALPALRRSSPSRRSSAPPARSCSETAPVPASPRAQR